MSEAAVPWTLVADGLLVSVRLTPKGGRDAIDGIERLADGQPVLKVRVRAAPAEGQANAALTGLLAHRLDRPRRAVSLAAGTTSRVKRVKIAGDGPALAAALDGIVHSRG